MFFAHFFKNFLFSVSKLKNYCAEYLDRYLDVTNCLTVKDLAEKYNMPGLMKNATLYVETHANQIFTESQELLEHNLFKYQSLFNDKSLDISSETQLLSILRWCSFKFDERETNFKQLLNNNVDFRRLDKRSVAQILDASPWLNCRNDCSDVATTSSQNETLFFTVLECIREHNLLHDKYETVYQSLSRKRSGDVSVYLNTNANPTSNVNNSSTSNCVAVSNLNCVTSAEFVPGSDSASYNNLFETNSNSFISNSAPSFDTILPNLNLAHFPLNAFNGGLNNNLAATSVNAESQNPVSPNTRLNGTLETRSVLLAPDPSIPVQNVEDCYERKPALAKLKSKPNMEHAPVDSLVLDSVFNESIVGQEVSLHLQVVNVKQEIPDSSPNQVDCRTFSPLNVVGSEPQISLVSVNPNIQNFLPEIESSTTIVNPDTEGLNHNNETEVYGNLCLPPLKLKLSRNVLPGELRLISCRLFERINCVCFFIFQL